MYRISWHNLLSRKFNTILTLGTVALTTAVIFAATLFTWTVRDGLRVGMDRLGADILVLPERAEIDVNQALFTGAPMNVYMGKDLAQRLRGMPGVARVTAQFFSQTLTQSCCSFPTAFRLVGYDPTTDFVLRPWMESHGLAALGADEIIVGASIPAFLGDQAAILGQALRVAGRLEPSGASLDSTIFMPIDTARRLSAESPYLQYLWQGGRRPGDLISAVLVKVTEPSQVPQVAEAIGDLGGVKVVVASQVLRSIRAHLSVLLTVLFGLGTLLWLVAVMGLLGRYAALVFERKKEVGILRAIGARREDIFRLVMAEAVATALIGGLGGIGLGGTVFGVAVEVIRGRTTYPLLLPSTGRMLGGAFVCLAFALLTGVMASLYPAGRCAGLDPATAIAQGELE